ncbi:MAG: hypothetical protein PHO76_12640 [Methylotenera sp.]|nr:hypothetical protein [Methylotenera sp.]MDD4926813.1 hypothetical protein [Methylotenera sp.]
MEPENLTSLTPNQPAARLWEIVDHACRHCLGRLVRSVKCEGSVVHRCCECGASEDGGNENLCWCGAEVLGHGKVFECFANPNKSMSTPQEILVRERPIIKGDGTLKQAAKRLANPVHIEGFS